MYIRYRLLSRIDMISNIILKIRLCICYNYGRCSHWVCCINIYLISCKIWSSIPIVYITDRYMCIQ